MDGFGMEMHHDTDSNECLKGRAYIMTIGIRDRTYFPEYCPVRPSSNDPFPECRRYCTSWVGSLSVYHFVQ